MFRFIKNKINYDPINKHQRELWLERVIASIPAGNKILDAGAGELQYKKYCSHLDYVSQDFGGYDGQGNGDGFQEGEWDNTRLDIVSDIVSIPVNDNSFDAIMCIEVLEHISSPCLAIKEFQRILKPGGKLVLSAPLNSLVHFAPFYYYSGFSKYWYEKYLPQYGFEINEIINNGNYFEQLAQEMGRSFSVVKNYSNSGMIQRALLYVCMIPALLVLIMINKKNHGSEDLNCFGYQLIATKK